MTDELHIPVGERVELRLTSADVIHSFWVPELSGKLDALPDGINTLVIEADEPGTYRGVCAEFCGLHHANMGFVVVAQPAAEFAEWLADTMSDGDLADLDTPESDVAPDTAERMQRLWADPPGLIGKLMAVQNDAIGKRLLFVGFFFLLLGGSVDSLVMRLQLALPENDFISPELYNELFTNHGSVTMFLVILPITEGFAILMLPFLLGTREMPFPRLGAYSFFTYLMGGLFYYSSTLFRLVPDAGWFAYTPLSLTALLARPVARLLGARPQRRRGRRHRRRHRDHHQHPQVPGAGDDARPHAAVRLGDARHGVHDRVRLHDARRRQPAARAEPQLRHEVLRPGGRRQLAAVAAPVLDLRPPRGVHPVPARRPASVSMILPVFVRRKIAGYPWLVAAFVAIGFMSFALWAHHMFAVGLPPIVSSFFSAASIAIGVPAGIQIFAWLATMWVGRPVWKTPLLFVVGFIVTFVDRRHHRDHGRLGAARPAGPRLLLRRRPPALRADRRRRLPVLRRRLLLAAQVHRQAARRAARQGQLLADVRRAAT